MNFLTESVMYCAIDTCTQFFVCHILTLPKSIVSGLFGRQPGQNYRPFLLVLTGILVASPLRQVSRLKLQNSPAGLARIGDSQRFSEGFPPMVRPS